VERTFILQAPVSAQEDRCCWKCGLSGSAGELRRTDRRAAHRACAPPSPPAFDHHALDFGQCAAGSTKRFGGSTKARLAAVNPSAGNQSSTSVSYWDATKSAGARHERIDYPTLS
jgi:hypothetical protein